VDDVFLFRRAARSVGLQAALQFVPDGVEALNYLRGQESYSDREHFPIPALVLLDIKMPRKSGFEVLEVLRATSEWKRLPVIIFSSSDEPQDIQRAMRLGANSYLVKPLTQGRLIEVIKKLQTEWLSGGGAGKPTLPDRLRLNSSDWSDWT
jgi:CheY-like chemotaxis protein